ncbi:MAG: zinc-ribbon domain-containing protein [Candidatus Heimdallarchaeaceae archaeon]
MARRNKYLNGLSITAIVFISITIIPLAIVGGIGFSEGNFNDISTILEPDDTKVIYLNKDNLYFINYYVNAGEDVAVSTFILDEYDYGIWNETGIPTSYQSFSREHAKFLYLDDTQEYLVLVNENNNSIKVHITMFTMNKGYFNAIIVLGIICSFFVTMLALHTIGYIIQQLIIIPISGGSRYVETRTSNDKRQDDKYYYYYPDKKSKTEVVETKPVTTEKTAAKTAKVTEPKTPHPTKQPTVVTTPVASQYFVPRSPAIANISDTYVRAKAPRTYNYNIKFFRTLRHQYDLTDLPERILGLVALFFFLLGCFTSTVWNIVSMPLILFIIATIIFYVAKNRRDKLILILESHGAIYLRDLSKLLNTSYKVVQNDIWKIISLGLADIAYDMKSDVVFIPGIEKSERALKARMNAKKEIRKTSLPFTSAPAQIESKPTDVKKAGKVEDLLCPFCDAKNPTGSSFCIKCGASLKPAK